ncbi:MAG: VWA domain-containing protein, partial [Saprospiraceae bacterium]
ARTGSPHIKIFDEERELTVMLLIDVSASVYFGTSSAFKSDVITEMAAVLSFSALTNNDKVGAILFSDHVEKYLPPKKGKQNILRLIRELINFTPSQQKTDISEALMFLNNTQKKRSITFVLSDFIADNYDQALTIAAKKHDIIGVRLYDKREQSLPDAGLINVQDEEAGKMRIIDTSNPIVRAAYESQFKKSSDRFSKYFASAKSDVITISTEDDYVKAFQVFFKRRAKR